MQADLAKRVKGAAHAVHYLDEKAKSQVPSIVNTAESNTRTPHSKTQRDQIREPHTQTHVATRSLDRVRHWWIRCSLQFCVG